MQVPSASGEKGAAGDNRIAASTADTAAGAAAAMARNIDFTLDGKAGLFKVLSCGFNVIRAL